MKQKCECVCECCDDDEVCMEEKRERERKCVFLLAKREREREREREECGGFMDKQNKKFSVCVSYSFEKRGRKEMCVCASLFLLCVFHIHSKRERRCVGD